MAKRGKNTEAGARPAKPAGKADFSTTQPAPAGGGSIAAATDATAAAGALAPVTHFPEGSSGTAREAPSTGSGTTAATPPSVEAQPGSPHVPPKLRVSAKQDRRRRAGQEFGRQPVEIDPEAIGEDMLRALVADPVLVVEVVGPSGVAARLTKLPPAGDELAALEKLAALPPPPPSAVSLPRFAGEDKAGG